MSSVDTRQLNRDSLFLMANLRVVGEPADAGHRVKVRNISAGGMMAEGKVPIERGTLVKLELRNIGWVDGSVAWRAGERFGIAFAEDIDPKLARGLPKSDDLDERLIRNVRPPVLMRGVPDPDKLRKI
jgi:hypothetical protein